MATRTEVFPSNKGVVDTNIDLFDENTKIKIFGSDVIVESADESLVIMYGAVFVSLGNTLSIRSNGKLVNLSELLYSPNATYEQIEEKIDESYQSKDIIAKSDEEEEQFSKAEVNKIVEDAIDNLKNSKEIVDSEDESLVSADNLETITETIANDDAPQKEVAPIELIELNTRKADRNAELNIFTTDKTDNPVIILPEGVFIPTWLLNTANDSGIKGDDKTNVATPTINGEFIANSEIVVVVVSGGNTTTYNVVVDEQGLWQQQLALGGSDGVYTITSSYTDGNGDNHTYSDIITLDTTVNNTTWQIADSSDSGTKGDNITNITTPTITGVAEAGATVEILIAGATIGQSTADTNGVWQFNILTANQLVENSNNITIRITDQSANIGTDIVANINIDTQAPITPTVTNANFAADSVQLGKIDNVIKGTAEALSIIEFRSNGDLIDTIEADSNGNWTFVLDTSSFVSGAYALSITSRDLAGNLSETYSKDITVVGSILAPTIGLAAESDTGFRENQTTDRTPTYEGKTEAGAIVAITRGSQSFSVIADSSGDWSYTETSTLEEGSYIISVIATSNGVPSLSSSLTYNIDLTNPFPVVINDAGNQISVARIATETPSSVEIAGTGEAGNRFYYNILDSNNNIIVSSQGIIRTIDENGAFAFSIEPTFANGIYSIQVIQQDGAGNYSSHASRSLAINPIAFNIINAGKDNTPDFVITSTEAITISVSITDSDNSVVYSLNNINKAAGVDYTFSSTTLVDGNYNIVVNAGTSTFSKSFTIDTVLSTPIVVIGSESIGLLANLAIDNTPKLSGTAEAGSTITITIGGNTYTDTVDNSGNWSITIVNALANGSHIANIVSVDTAGNTVSINYTFDVQDHTITPLNASNITLQADNVAYSNYSNDAQPVFNGTGAVAGTTILAMFNNNLVGSAIVANNQTWELTLNAGIAEGEHDIIFTVRDTHGNISEALTQTITIDRTAPSETPNITINNLINNSHLKSGTVSLEGNVSTTDAVLVVVTIIDSNNVSSTYGTGAISSDGSWSVVGINLDDGDYKISAAIEDRAGNSSTQSTEVSFTVDSVAKLDITSPNYGIDSNYDFMANLEDSSSTISITSISLESNSLNIANSNITNSGGNNAVSFDLGTVLGLSTNDLQNGNYAITLSVTDNIGNTNSYTHNIELLAENNPGAIALLGDDSNIAGNFVSSATPTISGSGAIGQSILIINNSQSIITQVGDNGNWSAQIQSIVDENTDTILNIISSGYGNENVSSIFSVNYDDPST